MPSRIVRAAFDRGQLPTIACINAAKTPLGVNLGALVSALQKFVEDSVAEEVLKGALKPGAHVIGTVNAEKNGLVFTSSETESVAPPPAEAKPAEEKPASVE